MQTTKEGQKKRGEKWEIVKKQTRYMLFCLRELDSNNLFFYVYFNVPILYFYMKISLK